MKDSQIAMVALCGLLFSLGGCVTASQQVKERETYWRQVLLSEAPVGTSKSDALLMFGRHNLVTTDGTYKTISDDGSEKSNCRYANRALTAVERSAVRGLYLKWDIEITVCLDDDNQVDSHYVGAWNAGV